MFAICALCLSASVSLPKMANRIYQLQGCKESGTTLPSPTQNTRSRADETAHLTSITLIVSTLITIISISIMILDYYAGKSSADMSDSHQQHLHIL